MPPTHWQLKGDPGTAGWIALILHRGMGALPHVDPTLRTGIMAWIDQLREQFGIPEEFLFRQDRITDFEARQGGINVHQHLLSYPPYNGILAVCGWCRFSDGKEFDHRGLVTCMLTDDPWRPERAQGTVTVMHAGEVRICNAFRLKCEHGIITPALGDGDTPQSIEKTQVISPKI